MMGIALTPGAGASVPDTIRQFLAQDDEPHAYRATRRLVAESGERRGWMDVATEFSPRSGFDYTIAAEGGSSFIRTRILRTLLDGERDAIATGEIMRSALIPSNYGFQPDGVDGDGFVRILLSPRRIECLLLTGTLLVRPLDGQPVRLQGRLVKSPSFWVKHVEIVRSYERIDGVVMPVSLESSAQLRLLGPATLRMTYVYTEIDGHRIEPRN
jgi:hypothetical protein